MTGEKHPERERLLAELRAIFNAGGERSLALQAAADALRRTGGYRWVGLYDVDHEHEEVKNIVYSGPGAPEFLTFPISKGLTGSDIAGRKTVNVSDVAADSRYLTAFGSTRSEIIVPVLDHDRKQVVGTIDVESEIPNAFDVTTQRTLEACAETPAVDIESSLQLGEHCTPPLLALRCEVSHGSLLEKLFTGGARMLRIRNLAVLLAFFACFVSPLHAQLGKTILVPAGSDADHQLNEISNATDPAQKLKLINAFAAAHAEGDYQILADEQYVLYYLNAKQYDKVYDYGAKLYALDPDNFSNAVNMVRAANEQGDTNRLFAEGEKAGAILQRFKAQPAPAGTDPGNWNVEMQQKLDAIKDNQEYIEESLANAAYHQKDAASQAALLVRYAKAFPDSPRSIQALDSAALLYQQAQNRPKMLETANTVLEKDPDNLGMLLLLADDYSEKGENLDKAEAYAKKAAQLCDTAKKPEGVADADWQKQVTLQKGLALSALGQIGLQKKDNAGAVDSLKKAAPLLKGNNTGYARNQYRLGFAYLNLKKAAEARQAFADAASVDSPYKQPALDKLKGIPAGAGKPAGKKPA